MNMSDASVIHMSYPKLFIDFSILYHDLYWFQNTLPFIIIIFFFFSKNIKSIKYASKYNNVIGIHKRIKLLIANFCTKQFSKSIQNIKTSVIKQQNYIYFLV